MSSDTQNGFAFLEALSDDISVESLGRNFDGVSAHTGVKVRPSTSGDIPSALQLLPGQSFYIGKTTLSIVPEEHSDLPIHSSDLPDSNFESYNHQVSQLSTPQRAARAGSTVMETPMPQMDHGSEVLTPILKQISGHAISGRKDSRKWPESPLKREVMRTVRDVNVLGYSSSQPELEKEDEHIANAAIGEPSRLYSQPEFKIEDDTTHATIAKPLEERVVDLEDSEMAGTGLGSKSPENPDSLLLNSRTHQEAEPEVSRASCILKVSERLSPSGVQVRPDEEPRTPSHPPIPAGTKRLPSPIGGVQPKRRPQGSDQSPSPQASSDPSSDRDDNLGDAPVRKKLKTATVSDEFLNEESQDSRQDEVIFIQRELSAPIDRPVSTDQVSSKASDPPIDRETRSSSSDQASQRSSTPPAGSKHISPAIRSVSRPHNTNRMPLESSFSSTRSKPQTPVSTVSASPFISGELNSSMRSTRSTAREEQNGLSSSDTEIRIVFASSSSAGDSKPFMKFLTSKGVKKVKSVYDCTALCVGKELKKTSKVILAVLLGKDIVTDSWVVDSVKGNDLLSIVPYIARDPQKEADWGISIEQAIYRGKKGLKVLQNYTIHFTPSVKKELGKNGFDELKEIVKCAGAKSVSSALLNKGPEEVASTIVVATQDDTGMAELQKLGWRAYTKDIISLSVLRGKLDLESDEFLIKEQKKESRKRKR